MSHDAEISFRNTVSDGTRKRDTGDDEYANNGCSSSRDNRLFKLLRVFSRRSTASRRTSRRKLNPSMYVRIPPQSAATAVLRCCGDRLDEVRFVVEAVVVKEHALLAALTVVAVGRTRSRFAVLAVMAGFARQPPPPISRHGATQVAIRGVVVAAVAIVPGSVARDTGRETRQNVGVVAGWPAKHGSVTERSRFSVAACCCINEAVVVVGLVVDDDDESRFCPLTP